MPDVDTRDLVEVGAANEVRALLRAARDRLHPSDVGLPDDGRRGCPGLRRSEVAALAGISELWYERFETGRRRVSFDVASRVAAALQLSAAERSIVFAFIAAQRKEHIRSIAGIPATVFAREVRRLYAASNLDELCASSIRLLSAGVSGELFFADRAEELGSRAVAAMGRGSSQLEGHLEPWAAEIVQWQAFTTPVFACGDLAAIGATHTAQYRDGFRSFAGAVIRDAVERRGAIGVVRRDTGAFTDQELAVVESVAAVVSLAVRGETLALAPTKT